MNRTRFLFVCMGNICRSPIVETVARIEFARAGFDVEVASAGTESYHIGEQADARAIAVAEAKGYPLAAHRARQVQRGDFQRYDHVFAMDHVNLHALRRFQAGEGAVEPLLLLGHAGSGADEVPDPYYGTRADFERVVTLAQEGVAELIRRWASAPLVR